MVVEFPVGKRKVSAVADVSFDIAEGETLGLVGESGCGKTTTGRAVLQLPTPTAGSVQLEGEELTDLAGLKLREMRRNLQMVFQDPVASLNPRRTVGQLVAEPMELWGPPDGFSVDDAVDVALNAVGLDPVRNKRKRRHELSGGQCQRVAIARALVLEPTVLLCDEPVSSLDVSVQAQIINLLHDLSNDLGLTMMFVAHDLAVVRNLSDRVAVMYLGKICEIGDADEVYRNSAHPYTTLLLASVPEARLDGGNIDGLQTEVEPPSPLDPPSGCRFRTRCPHASQKCTDEEPKTQMVGPDHFVACHHPLHVAADAIPVGV